MTQAFVGWVFKSITPVYINITPNYPSYKLEKYKAFICFTTFCYCNEQCLLICLDELHM